MPITTNVPLPNQSLATSQPLIQGNFVTIEAAFIQDHVDYGITGQGKHVQVTFPVQTGPTTNPITPPDIGLISLLNSFTTHNELNFVNDTGVSIPFTASLKALNGWTYLPSGVLLKWGSFTIGGPGTGIVLSANQGPPYASTSFSVYNVFVTSGFLGTVFAVTSYGSMSTPNNFTISASGGAGGQLQYLMIGNS